MAGGYRPGSGRSKAGYFRGVYCGSTYELCWVIYMMDNQIPFRRFSTRLESGGVVYYPDFLLADGSTIVETKGFEAADLVDKKTAVAEECGYRVKVLRKGDLQFAFEYVEYNYRTKRFYELYDDYKPKFTHSCGLCGVEFSSNRSIGVFCTRRCAGVYQKARNTSEGVNAKISKTLKDRAGHSNKGYKRTTKHMWITDGVSSTRICVNEPLPSGWRPGRVMK